MRPEKITCRELGIVSRKHRKSTRSLFVNYTEINPNKQELRLSSDRLYRGLYTN